MPFLLRRRRLLALPAICLIVLAAYVYRARPDWATTIYVVGLWASGNAEGCTYDNCVDRISTRVAEQLDLVTRDSRQLDSSVEGLSRWQTPLGEFYSVGSVVLYLVAEQLAGAYDVGGCQVRPGDVVIDGGANIGTFTRRALNAGAKQVIAVEVDPRNIAALRLTFASEVAQGRVVIVDQGLWDRQDTLTLHVYDNAALSSLVMEDRGESATPPRPVVVPLTTLDLLVEQLALTQVDVIKMDIEGAERQALRGAEATIRRFRPRMALATENLDDDISVIPAIVHGFGLGYEQTNGQCRITRPPFVVRPEVVCFSPR